MAEQGRMEFVAPLANLLISKIGKAKTRKGFSRSFRVMLSSLEKSLRSIQPMVYDMERSESEFLSQLKDAKDFVDGLLSSSTKSKRQLKSSGKPNYDRNKLESIQKMLKEIREKMSRSELHNFSVSKLKDLQEYLRSISTGPTVYDLERLVPSHIFTKEFLDLLNKANDYVAGLPASSPKSNNGSKAKVKQRVTLEDKKNLESIQEELKSFFQKYLLREREKLASSEKVTDEQVETDLQPLVNDLGVTIGSHVSNSSPVPVFKNIQIILDHLEKSQTTSSDNMLKLLVLLKEVKLLLTFLDGKDDPLDIIKYLVNCQVELVKLLTDKAVAKQVETQDKQNKGRKQNRTMEEQDWIRLICSASFVFLAYYYRGKYAISSVAIVTAVCIFVYTVIKISRHSNTTRALPQPQGQSSNSENTAGKPKEHGIFLNFRGSDARDTLAGPLDNYLGKENIITFFDERSIPKGKEYWDVIKSKIGTSVGAVTIISENYAESDDCLEELHLICERKKTQKDYILIPIFYDIEPEQLTDPKSQLRQALEKHNNANENCWVEALQSVAAINGYLYNSEKEKRLYVLIDKVVTDVKSQLQNISGGKKITPSSDVEELDNEDDTTEFEFKASSTSRRKQSRMNISTAIVCKI